jgi:hypothetical protein
VSEDESIFSLLAERDENQDEIQFANTILDFDLTLLQNDEHFTSNNKDEEKKKDEEYLMQKMKCKQKITMRKNVK